MNTFRLILVLLFFVSAISCDKSEDDSFSTNDEIAFQADYSNYAWGKQQKGFFIISDGTKYSYDNPEKWISLNEGTISAADFLCNINSCTNEGIIDISELNRMKTLVLKVDETQLSKAENKGADMGAESYSFYVKDATKESYRQIILLNRGDWFQENEDKDAQEIANWLIQLNNGRLYSTQKSQ